MADRFRNDEEKVAFVEETYKDSRTARERLGHFRDWAKWYRYTVLADQWETNLPTYRAKHTINLLDSILNRMIPIITDRIPTVYVMSLIEDNRMHDLASLITQHFPYLWERLSFDSTSEEVYYDALLYGTGIAKIYWDVYALRGKGEIAIDPCDPLTTYPDENASEMATTSRFVHAQIRSLYYIRKYYPKKGHLVKAEAEYSSVTPEEKERAKLIQVYPVDKTKPYVEDIEQAVFPAKERALVKESWIEDLESTDNKGNLTYPNGRVMTVANRIVLRDDPSPYYFLQEPPFTKCVLRPVPRKFWGKSEIQDLIELQKELNKRRSQITDNISLTGNPWTILFNTTGIKPSTITNKPGLVLPVNPSNFHQGGVIRTAPPPLPQYIVENPRMIKEEMELLAGVHAVIQGQRPEALGTGRAIQALQEGVMMKQSKRTRRAEAFVRDVCWKVLGLMLQNYKEPRATIISKIGDVPKKMSIPALSLPQEYQGYPLQSLFQIVVGTGAGAPTTKMERKDDALVLWDRQVIDDQELLEAFEYPNRTEILKRVGKKKEEMMRKIVSEEMAKREGEVPSGKGGMSVAR